MRHKSALVGAQVLAFLLLCQFSLAADFFTVPQFNVGAQPQAVATGDFNGDGITDIVAANANDNTVSVLIGKRAGYSSAQSYSVGSDSIGLAVADFNNDGRMDIMTVNGNGKVQLSLLIGNGNGGFQPAHPVYFQGQGPTALVVADFNSDGNADVAVASSRSESVSVMFGNGTGTFQRAVNYTLSQQDRPISLAAGDVNNDGVLDLLAGGSVSDVLLGNADGTFQAAIPVKIPTNYAILTDTNQDGNADIVATVSGGVLVALGNGNGSFQTGMIYPTGGANPNRVIADDVNTDGNVDLLVTNSASNVSFGVLLGNGNGTFQPPVLYAVGSDPLALAAGNFGQTHKPGVVITDPFSNSVDLVTANSNGTFQAPRITAGPTLHSAVAADVNADGKLDVLETLSQLQVLAGNGGGTFQPAILFPAGSDPSAIASGDLDGDNIADVVVTDILVHGKSTISVLLNNGAGNFAPPVSYDVANTPTAVALGDFNGDHKLDIVVSNLDSNTVSILLNNGDGSFQTSVAYPTAVGPNSLALADFNGDGKLDVAVQTAVRITILLGNGDGTFMPGVPYKAGSQILVGLHSADFNGDNKPDLVVGNSSSGTVSVLLNLGNGTFGAPLSVGVNGSARALEVGDFNLDGHQDIAVSDNQVDILNGNGDGTFQTRSQLNVCGGVVLIAANFNQDPRPDLLDVCGNGFLTVLPNQAGPH